MGDPEFGRLTSEIRQLLYGDPASSRFKKAAGRDRLTVAAHDIAEGAKGRASFATRLSILWGHTRPELIVACDVIVFVLAWELTVRILPDSPLHYSGPLGGHREPWPEGFSMGLTNRVRIWLHTGVTMVEIFLGFAIGSTIGLVLGTIVSQVRILEATLKLYLVAIQSLPKIAVAPIIVLWFGSAFLQVVIIDVYLLAVP